MTQTNTIRAEILLATYNGQAHLREQLDSIMAQRDGRWHLTVSDDGSTDETPAIIDEYVRRYPDRISRYRSGKRFGNARDHFFHLAGRCGAEYMLFCDQDDVWYPDKVGKTLSALIGAEERFGAETPILAFSDQTPTDAALNPLAPSLMRYQKQSFECFDWRGILMQNVVTGGAMGVNRALVALGAPKGDAAGVIMHDWWYAAVAARFGQIVYIDEPLGAYRQHAGNAVGAKNVGSMAYVRKKLGAPREVRRSIVRKKRQARAFQSAYEGMLTADDIAFLRAFGRTWSGPLFWARYQSLIYGAARKVGMLVLC